MFACILLRFDCSRITLETFQAVGAALKAVNNIRELDLSDNAVGIEVLFSLKWPLRIVFKCPSVKLLSASSI